MTRTGIFLLATLAISAGGVGVESMLALRHGFSARDEPTTLETVAARTARSLAVPQQAKQLRDPLPQTPENLAKGMQFWASSCATCHGNNGSGHTTIGRNVYPKAPDMRLPTTQNLTDGELYFTIVNGIRLTAMPAWGPPRSTSQLEDNNKEIWRAVQFIRHLPQLTPNEQQQLERMNPGATE